MTIIRVIGEHDHIVYPEGELGKAFAHFSVHDLGILEALFEGGLNFSVNRIGGVCEAVADADCQEQGHHDGGFFTSFKDCLAEEVGCVFHKTYFKCFYFFGLFT